MSWFAQAPANIALIKYMGKKDENNNIPDNPSLSYTLNNLLTSVTLEKHPGKKDFWEPLYTPGREPFTLSTAAQERFLAHLQFLKDEFNYHGAFIVRSSNNFPTGSGLASSASSFAALTTCVIRAISEINNIPLPSIETQAQLSRKGSGSSCRSFFSPWALWENDTVKSIDLAYPSLLHQVIIISHDEKQVSSGEAHRRVKTSPFYEGRNSRAVENLKNLLEAFKIKDWAEAYAICWREFQDLHHLFETSTSPFTDMTYATKKVRTDLQTFWQDKQNGPIVTMDAGSNIHLLYRPTDKELANEFKRDYLLGEYDVL